MMIHKDIDWITAKARQYDEVSSVMRWKGLEFQERWKLIVGTIQSLATLGTFIVALFGVWRVTPIITHQIERQIESKSSKSILSLLQSKEVGHKFVGETISWWTVQVMNYQRIMDLIMRRDQLNLDVNYEIVESTAENEPDLLVVTSVNKGGKKDVVEVPVNAKAMPPTQYIQRRINKGAFSALASTKREKVENAITYHMRAHMQPKVPPPYIKAGMSLEEVYEEISYAQVHRTEAIQNIRALKGIIDDAMAVE
jgi:hypothetical protein